MTSSQAFRHAFSHLHPFAVDFLVGLKLILALDIIFPPREANQRSMGEKEDVPADAIVANQPIGNMTRLGQDSDVAAQFLASLDPAIVNEPITKEESRRLLWKIDLIILPLLTVSVLIASVDKVIISNAAIYGMRDDTHLVGDQFSWTGSIVYFGFLVAEWPGNVLIQKLPLRTFYAATVLAWGGLTFATGGTNNFASIASVRFLCESPSIYKLGHLGADCNTSGNLRGYCLPRLHFGFSHVVDHR